jgi:hypothetical protein
MRERQVTEVEKSVPGLGMVSLMTSRIWPVLHVLGGLLMFFSLTYLMPIVAGVVYNDGTWNRFCAGHGDCLCFWRNPACSWAQQEAGTAAKGRIYPGDAGLDPDGVHRNRAA